MSNPLKIELASKQSPACFTAFDILYCQDHSTNLLPLTERKKLLDKAVISESARFAKSRYIEEKGIAFYNLAKQRDLEGLSQSGRTAYTSQGYDGAISIF